MRLWSLHPKYLDPQGLVALWRETLLAQAVLRGETRGYRHHPQLQRFQAQTDPEGAIGAYLRAVLAEARDRGYGFDGSKIRSARECAPIEVSTGQIMYEWRHLLQKLAARSPTVHEKWQDIEIPETHPLFSPVPGDVAPWEKHQEAP